MDLMSQIVRNLELEKVVKYKAVILSADFKYLNIQSVISNLDQIMQSSKANFKICTVCEKFNENQKNFIKEMLCTGKKDLLFLPIDQSKIEKMVRQLITENQEQY